MPGVDLSGWARFPRSPPTSMRPKKPIVDYFGNLIEIGDAYFYGAPPTAGRVVKINRSSIILEVPCFYGDDEIGVETPSLMTCKSPEKGVCLDKKGFL